MRIALLLAALAAFSLSTAPAALAGAPAGAPAHEPVVVELFTSQGCNSCPPADALLAKLATRADVLALGFHVDYWDYLGWSDTFALHAATERQRGYSKALGQGYLYTPEMIIAGTSAVVGSDDGAVEKAIARAEAAPHPLELGARRGVDGALILNVPAGAAAKPADLWLIGYQPMAQVPIKSGENAGHTIAYADAVHSIRNLGRWTGQAVTITLAPAELAGSTDWAVLLQVTGEGPILAALRLPAGGN